MPLRPIGGNSRSHPSRDRNLPHYTPRKMVTGRTGQFGTAERTPSFGWLQRPPDTVRAAAEDRFGCGGLGRFADRLVELTPQIAVDSTQLPGEFHRDPADRILVATANALHCPLLTADARIVSYPHVEAIGPA